MWTVCHFLNMIDLSLRRERNSGKLVGGKLWREEGRPPGGREHIYT